MSVIEVYTSSQSLLWFVLGREGKQGDSERVDALELVHSMNAFCQDWISPLNAAVRVESCDPSNYYAEDCATPPAQPAWFLRRTELDARLYVGPVWIESRERRASRIGDAELLALVEESLAQPPPALHLEVALAEVVIDATEIAVPQGIELSLRYGGRSIESVQVRAGERWLASGPTWGPAGPPVRLRASNSHGRTDLHVEFCWDFWRGHPAGLSQVRAAIDRVLGRGRDWQITEGNLPPQAGRVPSDLAER